MKEETICHIRCHKILTLILTFSARNPGISCLMTGDGLTGEQSRLRERINQLFDRLQTQLKQVIRESALTGSEQTKDALVVANLYLSIVEGRIRQFVRSGFKQSPLASWNSQWEMINQG